MGGRVETQQLPAQVEYSLPLPFPISHHGQSQHVLHILLLLYLKSERAGVAGELTTWKR